MTLRSQFTADPHRPRYHFLPPGNWMNDPNGLIQWQGAYHLFYQYNPAGPFHGRIHWGHAVSDDLVHWRDLPVALAPTQGGPDQDGCWSGCIVNHNGTPTVIYTGVHPQVVCLATSSDEMLTWEKYEDNPIIAAPPAGITRGDTWHFRDPRVFQEDGDWYLLMGASGEGDKATVLLYRSTDLIEWEYVHPLFSGNGSQRGPAWTGTMWECPDFFALNGRHILVVSAHDVVKNQMLYPVYFVGGHEGLRFRPERQGILDYGGYFYAPQSLLDESGRRLVWGWIMEGRTRMALQEAGWAGVASLPRQLSLTEGGRLEVGPAPELGTLRTEGWRAEGLTVGPGRVNPLRDVTGTALEIDVTFDPGDATAFGLHVRRSPDGEECTTLVFEPMAGRFLIQRAQSSLSPDVHREAILVPYKPAPGEKVRLHLFLDGSVLELFINQRQAASTRIYPLRRDSVGLALFATGGTAGVERLDVWQMGSIW
ncbi:MAG: glycoside hydrolase family 32 protein [Candidatus Promineifilaceae bacterium]|nr:glycoside hydrolase family 32 protein [Candidatus Promineifilaceae bacterium]